MPNTPLSYAIVSPVRDEAEFLPTTAKSILAQTVRPAQWVIVDDGSDDATPVIARQLAEEHDWITVVQRPRRKKRARGAPVIEAFHAGKETLTADYDVIVKLDGDLRFADHYFEWVLAVFERVPRAGIVGGTLYVPDQGRWTADLVGAHTVHGAVKAYRRAALEEMGGLQESMGWDGIDEYAARARGWSVQPLVELSVLHYKQRGSRQGWREARMEEGRGVHYMGYGGYGLAMRVLYRALKERPPIVAGLTIALGYLSSAMNRTPSCPDREAVRLMREEQRDRFWGLLKGRGDLRPEALPDGGPAFWFLSQGPRDDA
jgi:biofilm PGA synthesis N-glycosyltransferase PgaC